MWNYARGFMSRFGRNVAGNTLAMAAAALIPLIAAVGGAVDISRYYMANARLQAACDAGALAARKKMGDNTWEEADRLHGLTFFDQNYPDGLFGLKNLTRNYAADSNGTVTGTASGALPTTLMEIFNFGQLDLSVTCSAEINISNTDIMFVLDVTGSMNCPADDATCVNNNNVEASDAKIIGLRDAVMVFYDAVDSATSSTAQVRYGVVPYSQNINVGRSLPSQYVSAVIPTTTKRSLHTRVPQWDVDMETEQDSFTIDNVFNRGSDSDWYYWWNPDPESGVSTSAQCDQRAASSSLGSGETYIEGTLQENSITVVSETRVGNTITREITARARFSRGDPVAWYDSGYSPPCYIDVQYVRYYADIEATIVETVVSETTYFDGWEYRELEAADAWSDWTVTTNTAGYTTASVTLPTGSSGVDQTHNWDGCIREAETSATGTFDPVPTDAYDLDINLIPSTESQKWAPQLPDATYRRRSGGNNTRSDTPNHGYYDNNGNLRPSWYARPSYSCPLAAMKLGTRTRSDLETYVSKANGFLARGSTYHDMGMIWGARFISPRGIFASENATAPNGDAIGRHIVFMTDGELSTWNEALTAYGTEWWDRRISGNGNGGTSATRHAARFQAVCKQARQENISVWVVAFGTTLTQNLIDCATPGRAFHASDSEDLADKFEEIAERIAALRLTD